MVAAIALICSNYRNLHLLQVVKGRLCGRESITSEYTLFMFLLLHSFKEVFLVWWWRQHFSRQLTFVDQFFCTMNIEVCQCRALS